MMITPFVPAKDFYMSQDFYRFLGFDVTDPSDETDVSFCHCHLADNHFILQDDYDKDWASNAMYVIEVPDLQALHSKLRTSIDDGNLFDITMHGLYDKGFGEMMHVVDPSGVLWHVYQAPAE